jgi:hypothetical protein
MIDYQEVEDMIITLRKRAEYCDDQSPNVVARWKKEEQLYWMAADQISKLHKHIIRLEQEHTSLIARVAFAIKGE